MTIGNLGLAQVGTYISQARREQGLSQSVLAGRSALSQVQISYFELGRRQPTLDQLLGIAKALDVPVQRLLSGSDRPGEGLAEIAVELRRLGIEDLWVKGATVPGSFRRPEEVICLALAPREPDPRVVEAIPAVLAWNEISPTLLRAYGVVTRTTARVAWLADIALAIEKGGGFPGGCRRGPLERFLVALETAKRRVTTPAWDDLGKPRSRLPVSPIWKRWHIQYDASLDAFEERANLLNKLRIGARTRKSASRLGTVVRARRKKIDDAKKAGAPVDPPRAKAAAQRTTPEAQEPGKGDDRGRP